MSKTLMGTSRISARVSAIQPRESMRVTGLSKSQAEDLLDWLEANAYRDYHLAYAAGQGFTVSYSSSRGVIGLSIVTQFRR